MFGGNRCKSLRVIFKLTKKLRILLNAHLLEIWLPLDAHFWLDETSSKFGLLQKAKKSISKGQKGSS